MYINMVVVCQPTDFSVFIGLFEINQSCYNIAMFVACESVFCSIFSGVFKNARR